MARRAGWAASRRRPPARPPPAAVAADPRAGPASLTRAGGWFAARSGHRPVGLPRFAYRASDRDTSKAMTTPPVLTLGDVDRRHVFHPFSVLSEHESAGPRRMIVS